MATSLRGYPKELKFSLLTRERKIAYLRNIEQIQLILGLFNKATATMPDYADFKAELADAIHGIRQQCQTETSTKAPKLSTTPKQPKASNRRPVISHDTLYQFIESKRLEGITNRTQYRLSVNQQLPF